MEYRGKYIRFAKGRAKPKTKTWIVEALEGAFRLGTVEWFARWRKYGFFPAPDTVYEESCLIDMANFCRERTREHKEELRRNRGEGSNDSR